MYRGIHLLSIDSKGRLKIPARHLEQVNKNSSGKMVLSVHPDDSCLVLYSLKDWEKLELKIGSLPSLNIHTKKLARKLIGHACECDLDKLGRILIPSSHIKYANLVNKAILSGQGKSFEIWDDRTWKDQIEKLDRLSSEEEIPQQVLSHSL